MSRSHTRFRSSFAPFASQARDYIGSRSGHLHHGLKGFGIRLVHRGTFGRAGLPWPTVNYIPWDRMNFPGSPDVYPSEPMMAHVAGTGASLMFGEAVTTGRPKPPAFPEFPADLALDIWMPGTGGFQQPLELQSAFDAVNRGMGLCIIESGWGHAPNLLPEFELAQYDIRLLNNVDGLVARMVTDGFNHKLHQGIRIVGPWGMDDTFPPNALDYDWWIPNEYVQFDGWWPVGPAPLSDKWTVLAHVECPGIPVDRGFGPNFFGATVMVGHFGRGRVVLITAPKIVFGRNDYNQSLMSLVFEWATHDWAARRSYFSSQ